MIVGVTGPSRRPSDTRMTQSSPVQLITSESDVGWLVYAVKVAGIRWATSRCWLIFVITDVTDNMNHHLCLSRRPAGGCRANNHHHHVRVADERRGVTPVSRRMADLHNVENGIDDMI